MPVVHLSRKVVLAIEAVTAIAIEKDRTPVSMRRLGRWLNLSPRSLERALKALVEGGILRSEEGWTGGYHLGSPPKSITIKRIAEAIATVETEWSASVLEQGSGSALGQAVVRPYVEELFDRWSADLRETTVADLVEDAFHAGIIAIGVK